MSYRLKVTMQDQEGAMTRLLVLFTQRHLDVCEFSASRNDVGTITAHLVMDGPREALWALRQVSRHRNVLSASIQDDNAPQGQSWTRRTSNVVTPYRGSGKAFSRQRTVMIRRPSRWAAVKS